MYLPDKSVTRLYLACCPDMKCHVSLSHSAVLNSCLLSLRFTIQWRLQYGAAATYQLINLTERSRHLAVPCSKSASANFVAIACIVADLWRFLNFQNNGRLRLSCSILKIQIFKERCGSESIWAESCLEPPKKDGDFIILNNDRPLSWIFTIRNVNGCCDWDGKCAQSRQISEMWVFFDYL